MSASDAVLVTSMEERGPMVVKEAAPCNVPIISTNVGFVQEVIEGISNSYVCSSQEELTEQLSQVLFSGSQSNGRESLIEEADLEKMGNRLTRIYEQALD